ncbi:MAG: hypothetical protein ACYDC8_13035 [Gammaproteobacteria bacterium]
MKKLFTIGYEGTALDDFMRTLKAAKIDGLLDVRELPMSRRKGFFALMCYEKDHQACHRHSVANALAGLLGKTPIHLGVDNHAKKASETARPYPRQGVSAA